jgi:MraW methylase family
LNASTRYDRRAAPIAFGWEASRIAALTLSIDGLKHVLAYAADSSEDPRRIATSLLDPVVNLREVRHPVHRCKRPFADLFELPCFPGYNSAQQRRILRYLAQASARGARLDQLLGIDADPIELSMTAVRLRPLVVPPDALIDRRLNLRGVARFLAEFAPDGADLMLADLGVSSMQLDDPARGLRFKTDGPLDMRMDPSRGPSATGLLSQLDEVDLARLFVENEELRHPTAGRIREKSRARSLLMPEQMAE